MTIITEVNDKQILKQMLDNLKQSSDFLSLIHAANNRPDKARVLNDVRETNFHIIKASQSLRELISHYKGA